MGRFPVLEPPFYTVQDAGVFFNGGVDAPGHEGGEAQAAELSDDGKPVVHKSTSSKVRQAAPGIKAPRVDVWMRAVSLAALESSSMLQAK